MAIALVLMAVSAAGAAPRKATHRKAAQCDRAHVRGARPRGRRVCRLRSPKHSRRRTGEATLLGSAVRASRAAPAPAQTGTSKTKVQTSQSVTGATSPTAGGLSWAGWNILSNPIDPKQQTDLPFGDRSHWLQPWRAYLDTQPASMMRNAVGINFNVPPQYASVAAQFLAQQGFTRARLEIGWAAMSYSDPSQLQILRRSTRCSGALRPPESVP